MKENSREEDIARIAKLITTKFNNDYSIDNKDKEAIEHILSDYKRVLKENETLKAFTKSIFDEDIEKEFIRVQKLKDKIEGILNNGEYRIIFEGDAEFPDDATSISAQKYIKLDKLQELLEGRK